MAPSVGKSGQDAGFLPQRLEIGGRRGLGGVARQAALAGSREFLAPGVVQPLGGALAAAQRGDAARAAPAFQHDPDLLLGRMRLAGPAPHVAD